MRRKKNNQIEFDFQPPTFSLGVTQEYFERYASISRIIEENPEIVDLVHQDLNKLLENLNRIGPGRKCEVTSESVLRMLICQIVEGESLRGIAIRIDDSNSLRRFVQIYNGPMIDFTTLCTMKNAIRPRTWEKINRVLTRAAVEDGLIDGGKLRLDTTAVETNIRWPTDSGLLWDTYRVLCRLINTGREIDPDSASDRRLQRKLVKRLHSQIARHSGKKGVVSETVKGLYAKIIRLVDDLLEWVPSVCKRLGERFGIIDCSDVIEELIQQIEHFRALGRKVVDQARRRVMDGEKVPNEEKIFSIFEPHTELLKRGKASKPIEFGHMVVIQQVQEKFITDYRVFEKKPVDYTLVDPALESHRKIFGKNPDELSADKGFYEDMEKIKELEQEIEVVSIAKKGNRTDEEAAREKTKAFKLGQRFRAGVEGSISFLKRILGLWRCMNKGWQHFVCTVGATVFVHNLLVLSRV
jgi:IS5 family transposase